ncbi:MAG: hypothetical protein ACOX2A_01950 [Tepidanaerobacteraceae bacterium]
MYQKTWFIRAKECPVGHVFLIERKAIRNKASPSRKIREIKKTQADKVESSIKFN